MATTLNHFLELSMHCCGIVLTPVEHAYHLEEVCGERPDSVDIARSHELTQ